MSRKWSQTTAGGSVLATTMCLLTPAMAVAQDAGTASGTTQATAQDQSARDQRGDIIVNGQLLADDQTYVAHRTTAGTKTDTPLLEVPQSISVVSGAQIAAQDAQTIGQALRYSAGVQAEPFGFDPRFDQFIIRGFSENTVGKYRDGLRQVNGSFSLFIDEPYGLERLEVLRGPSSVLYGGNAPGGIVNSVSKRPTDIAFGEVVGQIGNFNRYQGQFDIGGPLASGGALTYRLTGLARDSDTQIRFGRDDRLFIAPAVTWHIGDRTTLTVLGEYERNRGQLWPYYHRQADGTVTHIVLTDPNFDTLRQHQFEAGYQLEHHFSPTVTFRQNLRYGQVRFFGQFVDEATTIGTTLYRYAGRFRDRDNSFNLDNQLEARVATGPIQHVLLLGVDHLNQHTALSYEQGVPPLFGGTTNVPPLDLTDPVYSTSPVGTLSPIFASATRLGQTGVYGQDQFRWGGLVVTAGGRYDWTDTTTTNQFSHSSASQSPGHFSGRIGAVYVFDDGLAPYIGYSTSFIPLAGTTFAGTPFNPTTGRQLEAGIKYQPHGSNSFLTGSLFTIRQDNLATADPAHTGFQIQVGRGRSRGAELYGVASLGGGLDLVGNYSFTDTRITRSNGVNLGKRFVGVPLHQASLWADYTATAGPLRGVGLGGGVRYVGPSWQDTANTAENDAYTVFDAAVRYDWRHIRIAVNATNVGDKSIPYCNSGNCTFTQERTVLGSVRFRW